MYSSRQSAKSGSQARDSFNQSRTSLGYFGSRQSDSNSTFNRPRYKSSSTSSYGSALGRFGSYRSKNLTSNSRGGRIGAYIPREKYIRKTTVEVAPMLEQQVPATPFAQMNLSEKMKQNIARHGYAIPMPIQNGVIPHILDGKDVVGIANTGTGKTGAFLIPILEKISKREINRSIIIVPTRELAQQIFDEFKFLANGLNVFATVCIGGASMYFQIRNLRHNPQVIIGTPGRLKDFATQGVLKLEDFDSVVLDEVDRMVDMGFIHDITHLLAQLPKKRQSLFFSATITKNVENTLRKFSQNPITVSVKTHETSDFVEQDVLVVKQGENKLQKLLELLKKKELEKVLIFGRTKRGVEKLAQELYNKGFKVESIHGDKPQRKRERAIRLYKDGIIDILVATDVAARGIDIEGITHVINFDEPATYDDYTHRIGRTGRANKKGYAYTFVVG